MFKVVNRILYQIIIILILFEFDQFKKTSLNLLDYSSNAKKLSLAVANIVALKTLCNGGRRLSVLLKFSYFGCFSKY